MEFLQNAIQLEEAEASRQLVDSGLAGKGVTEEQRELLEKVFQTLNPIDGRVGLEGLRALYLTLGIDPSDDSV